MTTGSSAPFAKSIVAVVCLKVWKHLLLSLPANSWSLQVGGAVSPYRCRTKDRHRSFAHASPSAASAGEWIVESAVITFVLGVSEHQFIDVPMDVRPLSLGSPFLAPVERRIGCSPEPSDRHQCGDSATASPSPLLGERDPSFRFRQQIEVRHCSGEPLSFLQCLEDRAQC